MSASSSPFINSQGTVPLTGLAPTKLEQSSMQTARGVKNVTIERDSHESKDISQCKVSDCFAQIVAGFVGSVVFLTGGTFIRNVYSGSPLLTDGMLSLSLSSGIGLMSGVLSENRKEAAQNAAIFGAGMFFILTLNDLG